MGDSIQTGADSMLFQPLKIGNGKIELKHRVVLAPLTRNRGTPVNSNSTAENPNRVWVPNDVMLDYYTQRATEGGLLITEGLPPSLEVSSHITIYHLSSPSPHSGCRPCGVLIRIRAYNMARKL
jgi:2,4-dienoyl-CoA reductase-like NADH-dependent reductase (Old Yellow Enzyme family)